MSDSECYYTSDEESSQTEGEIENSIAGTNIDSDDEAPVSSAPSANVTIGDSDDGSSDEDDDAIAVRAKRFGRPKRAVVIDSDSEDEDEEIDLESRALSPQTRMSITGIRPADLTDDSSEIEYSDEEASAGRMNRHRLSNISEGGSAPDTDSSKNDSVESAANRGSGLHTTLTSSTTDRSNPNIHSKVDESIVEEEISVVRENDVSLAYQSPLPARYSKHFADNINEKLSSTIYQSRKPEIDSTAGSDDVPSPVKTSTANSSDSDVQIVEKNENPIELSSDDNVTKENIFSVSNSLESPKHNRTSKPKIIQPKIQTAFTDVPSNKTGKTPQIKTNRRYVSQDFYDKEMNKMEELRSELASAEKLLAKISKTLPDGGRQLSLRVERLKADVDIQLRNVTSYIIEDAPGSCVPTFTLNDKDSPSEKLQNILKDRKAVLINQPPDWDALSAAVNQIQPTYTGKKGMATFNTQKVLTVDRLKDLHGSLESCPAENVVADDPEGLKVPLMHHQKHALAWMSWRERQKPRGGILADDMGLGKTLTMISMVLSCKNRSEEDDDANKNKEDTESDNDEEERTGPSKWSSKGRRDYYPGGTLVICPASLLRQWEAEVKTRISRHKLTVCVHHGNNRDTKPKHLRTYDIVVTTYNIVTREEKTGGAIFGLRWNRIILDEAHVVRNHKSQSSIAVCQLKGKCRWALTGTPIQNKEMDVYALLKFLRCSPFDDFAHWKKWIDKSAGGQQRLNTIMNSLMLRRTKVQLQERGELQTLPNKKVEVIEVELDNDEMNVYQKIMIYSRTLFAQFLFQRAERNTDLMYAEQSARPTYMQSKDPNGAYYKLHQKFTKLHQGTKEVKSHEILVLLLRLRQICCHPGLIDAMLEDEDACHIDADSDESQPEINLLEQLNKLAIKDDSATNLLPNMNNNDGDSSMGHTDAVIARASARVLQRNNPVFNVNRPSTKMRLVLKTIKERVIAAGDKAIVVSQWTSVLDILRTHIEREGVATLSLNGTIPVKNRQDIVTEFNKASSSKRILLLSLTAGGVGLNLVGANHLLLFDLHWNPQLEAQAQDRIYRVGQKKDVVIYKFMCKETVEERIKVLQDQKLALADGVLTGAGAAAGSKLTMDDLRGLFGL